MMQKIPQKGTTAPTLDDIIEKTPPKNFYIYGNPATGNVLVDQVIKYEALNQSLDEIFADRGVTFNGDLGVWAKGGLRTDRRPYHEVLSTRQIDRIAELFDDEIKLMGY